MSGNENRSGGQLSNVLLPHVGLSDEEAKAVSSVATFGTTAVTEGSALVRYIGRVLGTVPQDAVGLVLGDPLRFVRTTIAGQYDVWLTKILKRRGVAQTQPVSPSVAIPLLRAAYDEGRPELQELWAGLIAAAMDPNSAGRVRLSFIETLQRFDLLDALVLKKRSEITSEMMPNPVAFIANLIAERSGEVHISVENLKMLRCVDSPAYDVANFHVTDYGHGLLRACLA